MHDGGVIVGMDMLVLAQLHHCSTTRQAKKEAEERAAHITTVLLSAGGAGTDVAPGGEEAPALRHDVPSGEGATAPSASGSLSVCWVIVHNSVIPWKVLCLFVALQDDGEHEAPPPAVHSIFQLDGITVADVPVVAPGDAPTIGDVRDDPPTVSDAPSDDDDEHSDDADTPPGWARIEFSSKISAKTCRCCFCVCPAVNIILTCFVVFVVCSSEYYEST